MTGIKNGMVMQRNCNNVCEITVQGDFTDEIIFSGITTSGKADAVRLDNENFRITGIPVGGPYEVTVGKEIFTDIYVGDQWVLAGQSNMEGIGRFTEDDLRFIPENDVRALYMEDEWRPAKHPLHVLYYAKDEVHKLIGCGPPTGYTGVGPGLSFALRMKELTGVPQGVLCCAHGGTTMEMWNPDGKQSGSSKSLYAAMYRRYKANGSNIKGVFWYQGCSDALRDSINGFFENTKRFFAALRSDFGEKLPIVEAQISMLYGRGEDYDANWTRCREMQRRVALEDGLIDLVSTLDLRHDDEIHLNSVSQKTLGKRAADSMYALLYPENDYGLLPAPILKNFAISTDRISKNIIVRVNYKNISGKIESHGVPGGFCISSDTEKISDDRVFYTEPDGDSIIIKTLYKAGGTAPLYLFYGFGTTPCCTFMDSAGRPLPGFGPLKIRG